MLVLQYTGEGHLYNIMLVTSMELQLLKEFHRIECGENVNLRQIAIPLILADNDVQFTGQSSLQAGNKKYRRLFY